MSGSAGYDPMCGMWLAEDKITATYTYFNQTYVFCCDECRDLFAQAPEAHIVRLAHEPGTSAGHRCPHRRLERGGPTDRAAERKPPKD